MDEELYDLQKDPNEQNNLIDHDKYRDILNDLRFKLNSWLKSTNDPILRGKIPPQPGVRYNYNKK